jgi:hypothetical protein
MAQPHLRVFKRTVYGTDRFSPVNATAQTICDLMGAKTLTKEQINIVQSQGWTVDFVETESLEERRAKYNQ